MWVNRRSIWILLFGLVTPIVPASATGLSGTYVGKSNNDAFLVQIVEAPDGQLTGRYEQVVLQPTGEIDDMNASITGASDGQTVVVTIKPSVLLSSSMAASGTIEGGVLHLTGGGNGSNLTLNLIRSDEAAFREQTAALTEQARQINDARARREAAQHQAQVVATELAALQSLTKQIIAFTTKADVDLPKFSLVEQRYKNITARMRNALSRERSIYGDWQASVARSQLSVAINQISIQGTQLHWSVESEREDFATTARELAPEIMAASQRCHRAHVVTASNPAPVGNEAWNSACVGVLDAAQNFQQRLSDLRKAFADIEAVWNTENRKEVEIVRASDIAVQ